jgi:hypothetical protein
MVDLNFIDLVIIVKIMSAFLHAFDECSEKPEAILPTKGTLLEQLQDAIVELFQILRVKDPTLHH